MSFDLTKEAIKDLEAIAKHTQNTWGRDKRNAYLKQLDDVFHLLAQNPKIGVTCDDIRLGYRKFPQGKHVVFYKQLDGTSQVRIIRILHQRMDVTLHLNINQ